MGYQQLRDELHSFYLPDRKEHIQSFAEKCFAIMDARVEDTMSVASQKCLQYDVIAEEFEPVIFRHCPYFYETDVLSSLSDGGRFSKDYGIVQANGWVFMRNVHVIKKQDEALFYKRETHVKNFLYLMGSSYRDATQHFNFNCRPFLTGGLKSVYEQAKAAFPYAENVEEREFLESVCHGMLTMKRMAEKFAEKAVSMLTTETDETCRKNLSTIAQTAVRIPWEAPKNLYEALATLAFLRTVMGSLEGVGPNTFGRLDKDLIRFYQKDIADGILTREAAYDLICRFLLIWDCHYDHNMEMAGYADHELENTYTLGGCDDDGIPLYNEITKLFLEATDNEGIIFPKIKCRFSANSPEEYLNAISRPIIRGTSVVLLQNDDASIPAHVRGGKTLTEARDYMVTGCWGFAINQEKFDHGSYVNLLKPFEFALHRMQEKNALLGIDFVPFDEAGDFKAFYQTVLKNSELLIQARQDVTRLGGQTHCKIDHLPIFSSTLENCLEKRADFTQKGGKYRDDYLLMFGLPNIVDSLLAIKTLVFEKKKYTLPEFLHAVRTNWEGCEDMRLEATRCAGWGDGSAASCELANRFNNDLFAICQKQTGSYGGRVHMGHLTYTEIRWWGEQTLATPDGRRNGEYFAQGLTPSRLKKIPSVTDVIHSMASLDASTMGANSVVNIMLPSNTPLAHCNAFLRAVAGSAVQSLQLNCVSKEVLLDAQNNPQQYPDLIVRVTGFSAKFTSLSRGWQDEVISRNFYE